MISWGPRTRPSAMCPCWASRSARGHRRGPALVPWRRDLAVGQSAIPGHFVSRGWSVFRVSGVPGISATPQVSCFTSLRPRWECEPISHGLRCRAVRARMFRFTGHPGVGCCCWSISCCHRCCHVPATAPPSRRSTLRFPPLACRFRSACS